MEDFTNIYQHPDGHEIGIGDGLLTVCTAGGTAISIPIGPQGCTAIGHKLLALGAAANESEQAGSQLGGELVHELFSLRGRPQGEALSAVHDALLALANMEAHTERACGGFAAALVNVLEVGVANLPKKSEG